MGIAAPLPNRASRKMYESSSFVRGRLLQGDSVRRTSPLRILVAMRRVRRSYRKTRYRIFPTDDTLLTKRIVSTVGVDSAMTSPGSASLIHDTSQEVKKSSFVPPHTHTNTRPPTPTPPARSSPERRKGQADAAAINNAVYIAQAGNQRRLKPDAPGEPHVCAAAGRRELANPPYFPILARCGSYLTAQLDMGRAVRGAAGRGRGNRWPARGIFISVHYEGELQLSNSKV